MTEDEIEALEPIVSVVTEALGKMHVPSLSSDIMIAFLQNRAGFAVQMASDSLKNEPPAAIP